MSNASVKGPAELPALIMRLVIGALYVTEMLACGAVPTGVGAGPGARVQLSRISPVSSVKPS